jgi:hypothetical protein
MRYRCPVWLCLFALVSFAAQNPPNSAAIRHLLADASSIGLGTGVAAPPFTLNDQNGRAQNLETLSGPSGLVLVFFRSADW